MRWFIGFNVPSTHFRPLQDGFACKLWYDTCTCHHFIVLSHGEFTPSSRGHTLYVTALFCLPPKVPWFNLFYQNWYIMYISWPISRTVRHLTTALSTVMYRTVSLSKPYTQKATWAQSIVTSARWTRHHCNNHIAWTFI